MNKKKKTIKSYMREKSREVLELDGRGRKDFREAMFVNQFFGAIF